MDLAAPVMSGDSFDVTFTGGPHELALVAFGDDPLHLFALELHGLWLVANLDLLLGTLLDGDGHGQLTVTTPNAPAFVGSVLAMQSGFLTPALELRLGPSRHQVVVSDAP